MNYLNWDKSYELGISVIDKQHKRIVGYINELHFALAINDKNKASSVIEGVIEYTASHFSFEEALMKEAGYPMIDTHKKIHEAFAKTAEKYQKAINSGYDVTKMFMSELEIWFTHHVLGDDMDFKEDVKKMLEKRKNRKNKTTAITIRTQKRDLSKSQIINFSRL
jgi:hemerythrin